MKKVNIPPITFEVIGFAGNGEMKITVLYAMPPDEFKKRVFKKGARRLMKLLLKESSNAQKKLRKYAQQDLSCGKGEN